MTGSFRLFAKCRSIEASLSDRLRDETRDPGDRGLVAGVVDPAAALLRLDEAGAAQEAHVVVHGGLRQPHGPLDVARAEAGLAARDQVAARAALRLQQLEDPEAGRVPERLADRD